jgi:hypothetical protein
VISGFRHEVDAKCTLLGYYAASSGNLLPIGCSEMSVRNNHCSMRNNPEELGYHKILVEQPERKRPIGILKYKLENNIKNVS